jgi:alkylation response protein AidB-like acyl-CoA dehydrogenase
MTLSHAQLDLQKRARALARETIAPRAAEVDRSEQYPWENVKALADAGFFGMTIPKAYGGPGLGFLEAALVVDEVAQVCGVSGRIVVEANMGRSPLSCTTAAKHRRSSRRNLCSPATSPPSASPNPARDRPQAR